MASSGQKTSEAAQAVPLESQSAERSRETAPFGGAAAAPGAPISPRQAMQFQQTIGNRAVAQLMASQHQLQRSARSAETRPIQRKQHSSGMPDSFYAGKVNEDPALDAKAEVSGEHGLAASVQLKREPRTALQVKEHSSAHPALQRTWMAHKGTKLLRWDAPINGLRWYMEGDQLFFQIEKKDLPEDQLEKLEALEGRQNARTLDGWVSTGLFEESDEAPAPEEKSSEDLGPMTESGVPIPRIGFGTDGIDALTDTQKASVDPMTEPSVRKANAEKVISDALATGFRMFDTAESYGTLSTLGSELDKAMKKGALMPEDVFVIYKIKPKEVMLNYGGDLSKAVLKAIADLKIKKSIDVLMLHEFPESSALESIVLQMQSLVQAGLVRYLGASNVTVKQLEDVAKIGDSEIGMSFLQNKFHPMRQDDKTLAHSQEQGMTYMGYNILGSGSSTGTCKIAQLAEQMQEEAYDVREDQRMRDMAKEEGFDSSPQMALSWAMQKGTVQVPSSKNKARMLENFRARYLSVSDESMRKIAAFVANVDSTEVSVWADEGPVGEFKLYVYTECGLKDKALFAKLDSLFEMSDVGKALLDLPQIVDSKQVALILQALSGYMSLIDSGIYKNLEDFYKREPGDYSGIAAAAAKQKAPGLVTWYHHQENDLLNNHGCKDAKHEAMIQAASEGDYAVWLAAQEEKARKKIEASSAPKQGGAETEVSKTDLVGNLDALGWDWNEDPITAGPSEQSGVLNGKGIKFVLIKDNGATVIIRKTGDFAPWF